MTLGTWRFLFLTAVGASAVGAGAARYGPLARRLRADQAAIALGEGDGARALDLLAGADAPPEPALQYHLGSALLLLDRPADAAHAFEVALADADEPELRRRLFHNLARARLDEAMASPTGGAAGAVIGSIEAARDALRLDPRSNGTRRNLALAERLLSMLPSPAVRDRGGRPLGGATGRSSASEPGSRGPTRNGGGGVSTMSAAEARVILDAVGSAQGLTSADPVARLLNEVGRIPATRSGRGPPW
jgi:hypothetical protein